MQNRAARAPISATPRGAETSTWRSLNLFRAELQVFLAKMRSLLAIAAVVAVLSTASALEDIFPVDAARATQGTATAAVLSRSRGWRAGGVGVRSHDSAPRRLCAWRRRFAILQ
jgi:hypothetical protein